mgnify:CR=1 FL=1
MCNIFVNDRVISNPEERISIVGVVGECAEKDFGNVRIMFPEVFEGIVANAQQVELCIRMLLFVLVNGWCCHEMITNAMQIHNEVAFHKRVWGDVFKRVARG